VFAVNSGRITTRAGRIVPAAAGSLLIAASAAYWLAVTPAHPAYLGGFLPGLLIAGALAPFHRGWLLIMAAAAAAALAGPRGARTRRGSLRA